MKLHLAIVVGFLSVFEISAAQTAGSNYPFDGAWDVLYDCPESSEKEGARSFDKKFSAKIESGQFVGSYRAEGVPGNLQLVGVVDQEGVADLEAHGHTVDPRASVNRLQRGTAYRFKVSARFNEKSGSGERSGRRTCTFIFSRQKP